MSVVAGRVGDGVNRGGVGLCGCVDGAVGDADVRYEPVRLFGCDAHGSGSECGADAATDAVQQLADRRLGDGREDECLPPDGDGVEGEPEGLRVGELRAYGSRDGAEVVRAELVGPSDCLKREV